MRISDQLRGQAVADYLSGAKTQRQVCADFETRTGLPLSPRTLRAWVSSAPGAELPDELRSHLVRALEQLREVQHHFEAIVGGPPPRTDAAALASPAPDVSATLEDAAAALAAAAGLPKSLPSAAAPAAASMPPGIRTQTVSQAPRKGDIFWD